MRQPRKLIEGGRYHVCARANRKEMIMESVAMKDLFLETVGRAKHKYDFQIEHFCVMGNHFHMIIRPGKATSLSAIMQWILSVFAMRWNRIHGQTGHVWGERFFSRLLQGLTEYVQSFLYISDNPVKADLVRSADDWVHGGLWHFRWGLRGIMDHLPDWLTHLFRTSLQSAARN